MKRINLSRGLYCIVDDDIFDIVSKFKWFAHKSVNRFYAARVNPEIKGRRILLHRVIAESPDYMQVDHINGDSLDNRKSNLRICTASNNSKNRRIGSNNTSGFKGVNFNKRKNRWQSMIRVNSKRIWLGDYDDKVIAAKAYNEAAVKFHGEFCNLNKI